MLPRLLPFRMLLLFAFAAGWVHAQVAAQQPAHVTASLVSADASVQPGTPLTVAIRFLHDPNWHTYWLNPGIGLPTTLDWQLPPGWSAGPLQWPAPIILKDPKGNIAGNGYEGETFLPLTLTPPANLQPGGTVELKVGVDWLMCEAVCIPGSAALSLSLPVAGTAPQPDPDWGEKIRATIAGLPRTDPAWEITASRDAKTIVLRVTPAGAAAAHTPSNVHFFSEDQLVGFDVPQQVTSDGRGGWVLTLQVAPEGPQDATRLVGVLTSDSGWLPGATLRGLAVDIPFSGTLATTTAAGSQAGTPNSKPQTPISKLPGTLFLALIGGLILNLMPCVFPVLGIKILGFISQAGNQRGRIIAHGLVFTLGVLVSFWSLAGLLAVLRASGDQLGWGFQLQSPAFVYALTVVLLVFGLNLGGVFEFGLRATAVGSSLQTKSGYGGSFFTGVLATVVATPCSAPFLAPALGAALAVSTVQSFAIFTAIALGLSTPYLLLSVFPGLIKVLPRPGAWMETFKQFMAFPLFATVGYLVWVLAAQTGEEGFRGVLFSLVLIAMAIWMYGRWTAPGASPGRVRFGVASLVIVGALGLWVGWPRAAGAALGTAQGGTEIVWEPWSPETVAKLRSENRIVYVDFTARWCATCQTNKKLVFSSGEVLRLFAEKKVATLRADWTSQDPRITAELARYNRSAVPFNLIWAPGRNEPVVLPELLTAGIVLEALRDVEATPGS
ncbi:MAG: protein-disulfide reductase DsbD domain-containing protein [Opitutus sp.]